MKFTKKDILAILGVITSAFVYACAIKIFVNAGNLYPAGFSGISLLISRSLQEFAGLSVSFSLLYFGLNLIPTVLVFKHIGKRFTILSMIQYVLVSIFVAVLPQTPITDDLLLIAIFGGIIAGFANALALGVDASTGGTDFLAIYASNKYNMPTWNYVMVANAVVLSIAGVLYGWEIALYSIIYQFCSTTIVSRMHSRYKLNTLFIITNQADEVCTAIFKTCRHGITKLHAEGAFSHTEKEFLYMTCNGFQVNLILGAIQQADPKAFVTVSKTDRIVGNYYQQPFE